MKKFSIYNCLVLILFFSSFNAYSQSSESDPFAEFTSLMHSAKSEIMSSYDEASYNQTIESIYSRLDSLSTLYPDFEPSDSQITESSALFDSFIAIDDSIRDELGIEEELSEDEGENDYYDTLASSMASMVCDSIYAEFSVIKDCGERIIAILAHENSKFEEATNTFGLKLESAILSALLTRVGEECADYMPHGDIEERIMKSVERSYMVYQAASKRLEQQESEEESNYFDDVEYVIDTDESLE